ncbi:MAG: VWA domain-containing protein [Flavobacteriales bacterium]|nr:VWA domain-containing protein [Flavobacteriales bacterium]
MYELDKPIYFYLLLLIPVMWGLFAYALAYRKKRQEAFASSKLLMTLAPYRSTTALVWKYILYSLSIICITLALVNPRIGTKIEKVKMQGSDVVFALDISLSMKAEDVTPNRLSKAKQIISRTVDALGGDRIGIVVYAGSAYPLLPITSDYSAAKMFLGTAEPGMVSSQGTSLGEAIVMGQKYFDDPTVKNKLLVIISDGEDHDEDLDAKSIASAAHDAGIKIYTIGVGTTSGGPIPFRGLDGLISSYKKDSQGEVVVTKAQPDVLSSIAQSAGGEYIDGTSTQKVVDKITDILGKGEKNEYGMTEIVEYKDRYQWFAGAALLFMIADILMGYRRNRWMSRYNLFGEERPEDED